MPPAARVTDMHVCPMVTGVVPHVGGPIMPPGVPTVLIDFLPAATVTNMLTCVGPPDIIVKGSAGVFINFLPAARLGDQTAHGGVIVMGAPNVIIGEMGSPNPGAAGLSGIVKGLAMTLGAMQSAVSSVLGVGTDLVAKGIARAGAYVLAGRPDAQKRLMERFPGETSQAPFDGKVIGVGCRPTEPDSVQTAQGMRPARCAVGSTVPRVYFANGINTKVYGSGATMCETMQKIADQTCAEVIGIYGASKGFAVDLDEALKEVKKESNSKQAQTLARLMMDSASSSSPQTVNIVAHSRGGLATQEGATIAKTGLMWQGGMTPEEATNAMSQINIYAYGTASSGWPTGPFYTKLNNSADPVPSAIQGAQDRLGVATTSDNDPTKTKAFYSPHFNPKDAHSLDDIYVSHMSQAPGHRTCNCS